MIAIEDTLVSDLLFERKFVCNLTACKGACCVQGDSGAPLTQEEEKEIRKFLPQIEPYMTGEGKKVVAQKGISELDDDEDLVTPLIGHKGPCAFVRYEGGIAKCAIEKAWEEGKITFRKPISCHLYPIRVDKYPEFTAVNYHQWEVCSPACKHGEKLGVPVYQFLKDPIIRAFGEEYFQKLEEADHLLKTHRQ